MVLIGLRVVEPIKRWVEWDYSYIFFAASKKENQKKYIVFLGSILCTVIYEIAVFIAIFSLIVIFYHMYI